MRGINKKKKYIYVKQINTHESVYARNVPFEISKMKLGIF